MRFISFMINTANSDHRFNRLGALFVRGRLLRLRPFSKRICTACCSDIHRQPFDRLRGSSQVFSIASFRGVSAASSRRIGFGVRAGGGGWMDSRHVMILLFVFHSCCYICWHTRSMTGARFRTAVVGWRLEWMHSTGSYRHRKRPSNCHNCLAQGPRTETSVGDFVDSVERERTGPRLLQGFLSIVGNGPDHVRQWWVVGATGLTFTFWTFQCQ